VSPATGRSLTSPVTGHFAGTSLPTSSSALSLSLLEMVSGQSAYTDSLPSVLSPPPSMVARRCDSWQEYRFFHRNLPYISYGCKQGMLGRSPGTIQPDNVWYVVSSGVSPAHQQSRNASSFSSCISFPITSSGLLCDCVNRQHISRSLHPGTGVNTLPLPVSGNQELTRSLKEPQHLFLVLTYQVVSTPWRTVCLANTSSFRRIGHLNRKRPSVFFSRSVIQWSTCLRPETTTDFLCT